MRTANCNSCGSEIIFAKGSEGVCVVLDAMPHPLGTRVLDAYGDCGPRIPGMEPDMRIKYLPHWLNCPERP